MTGRKTNITTLLHHDPRRPGLVVAAACRTDGGASAARFRVSSGSDQTGISSSDPVVAGLRILSPHPLACRDLNATLAVFVEARIQFPKSGPRLWRSLRPTGRTGDAAAGFVQRPAIPPRRRRAGWQSYNSRRNTGHCSAVAAALDRSCRRRYRAGWEKPYVPGAEVRWPPWANFFPHGGRPHWWNSSSAAARQRLRIP